eukprot:symbB.v1.2.026321.t1/scaffold2614.1/size123634/3
MGRDEVRVVKAESQRGRGTGRVPGLPPLLLQEILLMVLEKELERSSVPAWHWCFPKLLMMLTNHCEELGDSTLGKSSQQKHQIALAVQEHDRQDKDLSRPSLSERCSSKHSRAATLICSCAFFALAFARASCCSRRNTSTEASGASFWSG